MKSVVIGLIEKAELRRSILAFSKKERQESKMRWLLQRNGQKNRKNMWSGLNLSVSGDFGRISYNSIFLVLWVAACRDAYGIWAGNHPKIGLSKIRVHKMLNRPNRKRGVAAEFSCFLKKRKAGVKNEMAFAQERTKEQKEHVVCHLLA